MSPRLAIDDCPNVAATEAVSRADGGVPLPLSPAASDFSDVVFSQSSVRVQRSFDSGLAMTPLAHHVADVRGLVPEEQVIRSDTRRVVAMVQDGDAFWNRAEVDLPRRAMRLHGSFVGRHVGLAVHPGFAEVASPYPTLAGFVDVGPEARLDWPGLVVRGLPSFVVSVEVQPLTAISIGFVEGLAATTCTKDHHKGGRLRC